MRTLRALRVSVRGLFAHKMRVGLAMLSVSGGVIAVIVSGAIGEGAQKEVLRQTEILGPNLLVATPVDVGRSAARPELKGEVTTLKLADYEAIARLKRVSLAAPGFQGSETTVKAENHAMNATVLGTTSAYIDICKFHVRLGRFFDADDNSNARRVVVLGARVNSTLFGHRNPIGEQLRIGSVPFEIIGVFEAKGLLPDGSDQDGQVVIPIRTAMQRLFNNRWINDVFITVRDFSEMDDTRLEIAQLLRERHRLALRNKSDDFSIRDKTQVLAVRRKLSESFSLLTAGLAATSLIVGGVGVLALMLMLVRERTGEIGLRMAVGAKRRDILVQFLLEAASIAAGGWIVGVILGISAALIITRMTEWKTSISPDLVLGTLAVVAVSGLGFGAYPARKASLLLPIQALRTE